MSFLSHFQWKKVFTQNKEELWEISWVIFQVGTQKIIGFIYKKSFLQYAHFFIEDIILNTNDSCIIKKMFPNQEGIYDLILKQVRDDFSQVIWNIQDIEWDEYSYTLENIIIDAGYNLSSIEILSPSKISIKKTILKVSKKAIISYGKDYLLIENNQRIKENKKTLENISKIFINIQNPSYTINLKNYDKL